MGFISEWTQKETKTKQDDEVWCPRRYWQPIPLVETMMLLCGPTSQLLFWVCSLSVLLVFEAVYTCKSCTQSICSDVCISCQCGWAVPCWTQTKRDCSVWSVLTARTCDTVVCKSETAKCVEKKWKPRCLMCSCLVLWSAVGWWVISVIFGVDLPFDDRKSSFSCSECEREVSEAWMWWQQSECVRRRGSGDYMWRFPLISPTDTLTFHLNSLEAKELNNFMFAFCFFQY